MNIFSLIRDFNRDVIGLPIPNEPTLLTKQRVDYASGHLDEESQELRDAPTIADQIDALIDSIYVAGGRLIELGLTPDQCEAHFQEVHVPNMDRIRGQKSNRPNSLGFDAIKPEGWVGPNHDKLLALWVRKPKIIILGHARHGKDTVAEILRDNYGYKFQSSSMFCAEKVIMPYFEAQGVPYATVEQCYKDRVNHRATWFDQIELYNANDRARLCQEMFETNDIYVGMRSELELAAARIHADLIIWVDASGRGVPPEASDSCTVTEEMADGTLHNDGTLEELEQAVKHLANFIRTGELKAS